jgi:hypothetical protein
VTRRIRRQNTRYLGDRTLARRFSTHSLAALRRISRTQVEALVRDAEAKGRVIGVPMAVTDEEDDRPWTAPPSRP